LFIQRLFHELINGLAQVVDGVFIAGAYRVHHAVAHVIFQDHLAGIIQGGADGRQLHQHFGTVITFFHHAFDFFQVADGTGEAVDHCLLIFVDMTVRMGKTVGMHIGVLVGMFVIVDVVAHGNPFFLRVFPIIPYFSQNCKPYGGIIISAKRFSKIDGMACFCYNLKLKKCAPCWRIYYENEKNEEPGAPYGGLRGLPDPGACGV